MNHITASHTNITYAVNLGLDRAFNQFQLRNAAEVQLDYLWSVLLVVYNEAEVCLVSRTKKIYALLLHTNYNTGCRKSTWRIFEI